MLDLLLATVIEILKFFFQNERSNLMEKTRNTITLLGMEIELKEQKELYKLSFR